MSRPDMPYLGLGLLAASLIVSAATALVHNAGEPTTDTTLALHSFTLDTKSSVGPAYDIAAATQSVSITGARDAVAEDCKGAARCPLTLANGTAGTFAPNQPDDGAQPWLAALRPNDGTCEGAVMRVSGRVLPRHVGELTFERVNPNDCAWTATLTLATGVGVTFPTLDVPLPPLKGNGPNVSLRHGGGVKMTLRQSDLSNALIIEDLTHISGARLSGVLARELTLFAGPLCRCRLQPGQPVSLRGDVRLAGLRFDDTGRTVLATVSARKDGQLLDGTDGCRWPWYALGFDFLTALLAAGGLAGVVWGLRR